MKIDEQILTLSPEKPTHSNNFIIMGGSKDNTLKANEQARK